MIDQQSPASATPDVMSLICRAVRQETPTVKTFVFEAAAPIRHEAGQALSLATVIDGERLARTFSIASAPIDGLPIEVTIKAQPGGRMTRWLHRTVSPGSLLEARRPFGQFTLGRRRPDAPLAFLSAGSGATPLMSMLRHLARTAPETDISWFHAARDASEILFAEELRRLQSRMPNLDVAVALTAPGPGWFGYRGRVTRRLLSVALPDLGRRDAFCCGPAGFMQEIKLIHAAEGGQPAWFHSEAFHASGRIEPDPDAAPPAIAGQQFQLRIGEANIGIGERETVLQAALRQGVIIPCGCGQGLCGTCRVALIDGTVNLRHQGGISPEEEKAGYILACSSHAESDLVVRL